MSKPTALDRSRRAALLAAWPDPAFQAAALTVLATHGPLISLLLAVADAPPPPALVALVAELTADRWAGKAAQQVQAQWARH